MDDYWLDCRHCKENRIYTLFIFSFKNVGKTNNDEAVISEVLCEYFFIHDKLSRDYRNVINNTLLAKDFFTVNYFSEYVYYMLHFFSLFIIIMYMYNL